MLDRFINNPLCTHTMAKKILFNVLENEFTLKQNDSVTGALNESVIPPKYSPEDKYGKYRRMVKEKQE